MRFIIISSVLILLCGGNLVAQGPDAGDSVSIARKKKYNFRFTTRLTSRGMFNFSGRICTDNPAFDFSVVYDRKSWGIMNFNVVDLQNIHSDNNFSLTLLYTRIKIGKRITFTPHTGYLIGDWGKEKGDRQIFITAVKVNARLHVDHTMLIPNVFSKTDHDWVNRVRLLYTADDHLDFILSCWHNNRVFDRAEYFSTALNISYNRIKVSNHMQLNTGITFLLMADTNDEEMFPKKNGLVFTVGAVFD
jgi:hypothetical protein